MRSLFQKSRIKPSVDVDLELQLSKDQIFTIKETEERLIKAKEENINW
jgi:hypothetical protein